MTYSYVKRRFCTTNLKLKPQAVCLHKVACIQLLSMCILGTFIVYTFAWCSALRERYSFLPCFPAFQIVNCFHLASTKSCTAFTLSFHIVLLLTNRDLDQGPCLLIGQYNTIWRCTHEYIFKNSASNMNSITPKLVPVFVSFSLYTASDQKLELGKPGLWNNNHSVCKDTFSGMKH